MSDAITTDDVEAAEKADLEGVVEVKHGDKTVKYDADARARAIARAKWRLRNRPKSRYAAPGRGY